MREEEGMPKQRLGLILVRLRQNWLKAGLQACFPLLGETLKLAIPRRCDVVFADGTELIPGRARSGTATQRDRIGPTDTNRVACRPSRHQLARWQG